MWWFERNSRLTTAQMTVLNKARAGPPLLVSDVTLWEIATLSSLGRLQFEIPLQEWLERATAAPLVERCRITPAIAAQVAALPETFHRDPADRLLVSTAIVTEAILLTADVKIIQSGLVTTL